MKLKTVLVPLVGVCLLTACEDLFEGGSLKPDGSNPNLTINNPALNQIVSQGKELRIYVTAVDKDQVKDLEVVVKGQNAETPLTSFKTFPGKKIVEYDTTITLNEMASGKYSLIINAVDGRTNRATKETSFTVQ